MVAAQAIRLLERTLEAPGVEDSREVDERASDGGDGDFGADRSLLLVNLALVEGDPSAAGPAAGLARTHRDRSMSDRVYASVDRAQPPQAKPALDCLLPDAKRVQLAFRDDAILPLCQRRQAPFAPNEPVSVAGGEKRLSFGFHMNLKLSR